MIKLEFVFSDKQIKKYEFESSDKISNVYDKLKEELNYKFSLLYNGKIIKHETDVSTFDKDSRIYVVKLKNTTNQFINAGVINSNNINSIFNNIFGEQEPNDFLNYQVFLVLKLDVLLHVLPELLQPFYEQYV